MNYAVSYCKEYDLIDDKRFVKIAVSSLKLKGKSKRHIIDYLKKCKVKSSLIEKASNSISDKSENKALKEAIKKYYRVYEHKENKEDYIIKALMRKGFKI
ncbi:RecX family transcriptional regulator [Brachyspira hyodysenteriae]|nr:RecX family transcriptional regulator [Brachyspira hyodysenteriae]